MKDQLLNYKNQMLESWNGLSKNNKLLVSGGFLLFIVALILLVTWASRPEFVTIYTNLSPAETGEIVEEIESRGVPVRISPDGRSLSVPKAEAARLKVDLAHSGIPRSGNINYSVFSENMGFGMTDRQFDVVERDAMQNELRYLIEQIEGIQQARVMITLPRENTWLFDGEQTASASVVITTRPGLELNQTQVQGLYHLIGRSIPKLPVENIVIMNQNWQAFELMEDYEVNNTLSTHQQQRQIRKDIERDIQRELHQLLGTILGMERVIVSVFASIDFSKEMREEHIVQPVDTNTNEGIAISIERIQESFVGEGGAVGGIPGTGETDIANYPGGSTGQNSEYEKIEERINREVNRIFRQVESSPFVIDDLAINVGVEPPVVDNPDSLSQQDIEDIKSILRSVIRTYLSSSTLVLNDAEIDGKVTVFANEFRGRTPFDEISTSGISPTLLYSLIAVTVLSLAVAAIAVVRRRNRVVEVEEMEAKPAYDIGDYDFDQENEETARRKRIERLAQNKPEEFVKLLRTWISED